MIRTNRKVRILRDKPDTRTTTSHARDVDKLEIPASERTRRNAWDEMRAHKFNKNHSSGELPPETPWGFYFGLAAGVAALYYGKKLLK